MEKEAQEYARKQTVVILSSDKKDENKEKEKEKEDIKQDQVGFWHSWWLPVHIGS